MKRHGDLWYHITDIENIYRAYRAARKGKAWQKTVEVFDRKRNINLLKIRKLLMTKTFTTAGYKERIIYEPKQRTIYKLPFNPDRIVQHALMNVLEPIWDAMFIFDSYACRKKKGLHAGSRRTMQFVRRNKYCLKMDISKFYPSIDHDILFNIVRRKIKCKSTLWLIKNIIYSFPGGKNVPIGNYTSQWFGNMYLNEMDQNLKHRHRVKDYLRYCDDFCLFHNDKNYLGEMAEVVKNFLKSKLKLNLSKCDLFPVSRGVDFLGYRHFPKYILIRKSTAKRVRRRLFELPQKLVFGRVSHDRFRGQVASAAGWMRWANSHNLQNRLHFSELQEMAKNAAY